MEYVLTLWLVFAGELHLGHVAVIDDFHCAPVAAAMAKEAGAELVAFHCALIIDA